MGTTRVEEVMVTKIVAVHADYKMERVAKIFEENDINAAPVVDKSGKCLGIISNHDLVEYESKKSVISKTVNDSKYAVKIFNTEEKFRAPGNRFDEAGFHMSTLLQTVSVDDPLTKVARRMCTQHIHHIIVLDDQERPIGFLSSLDLLGFAIGEPVCRSAICPSN